LESAIIEGMCIRNEEDTSLYKTMPAKKEKKIEINGSKLH